MYKQFYKIFTTTILVLLTVVPCIFVFANWHNSNTHISIFQNDNDNTQISFLKNDNDSTHVQQIKNKNFESDVTTETTKDNEKIFDNLERCRLPIVMYHSILNSAKSTYIVSEQQFKNDLIAFKSAGYTTVFPSEVINYANGNGTLPENPLLISFDDGHYNNMHYALPLLKEYNSKAVINIVGEFSQFTTKSGDMSNPNYSHLTWSQIGELRESGVFEIGNHSFSMHRYKPRFGISQKYNEPDDTYITNLTNDVEKLQNILQDCSKVRPTVFAYPFGKYSYIARTTLVSLGFQMFLTCNEGTNTLKKGDPSSLYCMYRINRAGQYSTSKLMEKVNA